jgi:hypothetical protein
MEELFRRFYYSLDASLRLLIEYKAAKRGASLSEFFEKPHLFFRFVELELGRHIAELMRRLFADFARRHGVDPEAAAEALRGPEEWRRFVEHLGSPRSWM